MGITREELYEQVWKEPMTSVARRHKVSANYLARVCISLNVPHPPRGYWARLKVGKSDRVPTLPRVRVGEPLEWSRDGSAPARAIGPFTAAAAAEPRRKPEHRSAQHRLLVGVGELFESGRTTANGYLRPHKRNIVDVFVSRQARRSAISAANSIFLELEDRGHRVDLVSGAHPYRRPRVVPTGEKVREDVYQPDKWSPGQPTVVFIGDVTIGLSFYELSENVAMRYVGDGKYVRISDLPPARRASPRRPREWDTKRDQPSGRLVLRAYSARHGTSWERQWTEKAPGDFEGGAAQIASDLERAAPSIATHVTEAIQRAEEERRRRDAEWRAFERRERARKRAEARKASRDQLLAIVDAWNLARSVEAFFEEIERSVNEAPPEEHKRLVERVAVARRLLGGIDARERFAIWKTPPEADAADKDDE